jgi:NitT/TauT family transport system substrate-binding protein
MQESKRTWRLWAVVLAVAASMLVAACGSTAASQSSDTGPVTLRLGYLPNLTHAGAIIGVSKGFFAQALGNNVTLKTQTFNAGPDEVTAMFGGALDMAFMGPSPAIDGFVKSHGQALLVVSGATVGGAALVVRPAAGISTAADLRGRRIATPQLGNTQDVALRNYLLNYGLHTTPQGTGDVNIVNASNSTILTLFQQGQIDGAWVPEPYESRLVNDDAGKVLVDEASLWPGGKFDTTLLVVSTSFLTAHADVVAKFLAGNLVTSDWINANQGQAETAANDGLMTLTGKATPTKVLQTAWPHMQFTVDPVASAVQTAAQDLVRVGLASNVNIHGLFDLGPLNQLLQQRGRPTVSDGGLGASS